MSLLTLLSNPSLVTLLRPCTNRNSAKDENDCAYPVRRIVFAGELTARSNRKIVVDGLLEPRCQGFGNAVGLNFTTLCVHRILGIMIIHCVVLDAVHEIERQRSARRLRDREQTRHSLVTVIEIFVA